MPQCLQRMSKFSKLACNSSLLLAEEYTPTSWLQPLHMVYNRIAFFSKVNSLRQTYSEKNITNILIVPVMNLNGKGKAQNFSKNYQKFIISNYIS